MKLTFSQHALDEIRIRELDLKLVRQVALNPEQVIPQRQARLCCQSRILALDGKIYLVRVITEDGKHGRRVITAYLTSRVSKYWRVS